MRSGMLLWGVGVSVLGLGLAAGCGGRVSLEDGSGRQEGDDAGIEVDAGESGSESGSTMTNPLGIVTCATNKDCSGGATCATTPFGGFCIPNLAGLGGSSGAAGGFAITSCTANKDCSNGATCTTTPFGGFCLGGGIFGGGSGSTSGSGSGSATGGLGNISTCSSDKDCSNGATCAQTLFGGFCLGGTPGGGSGASSGASGGLGGLISPCTSNGDCSAGGTCTQTLFGGLCLNIPGAGSGSGLGGFAFDAGAFGGIATCTGGGTCPNAETCVETPLGGFCLPGNFGDGGLGNIFRPRDAGAGPVSDGGH